MFDKIVRVLWLVLALLFIVVLNRFADNGRYIKEYAGAVFDSRTGTITLPKISPEFIRSVEKESARADSIKQANIVSRLVADEFDVKKYFAAEKYDLPDSTLDK